MRNNIGIEERILKKEKVKLRGNERSKGEVKKIEIMDEKNKSEGEKRKKIMKKIESLNVEVVGRIVEDKKVRWKRKKERKNKKWKIEKGKIEDRSERMIRMEKKIINIGEEMEMIEIKDEILEEKVGKIMGKGLIRVKNVEIMVKIGNLKIEEKKKGERIRWKIVCEKGKKSSIEREVR